MPLVLTDLIGLLGHFLRAVGFLVAGLALGRLVFDHLKLGAWQVQVALMLGLFGLLIGITAFSSPGAAGALALGVGLAYFFNIMPPKTEPPSENN